MPGASAYFLGGAVVYTQVARRALLDIPDAAMTGMRASTEAYALLLARTARERFSATWALSETGATGPTGNRYGDAAGHSCIAVAGAVERAITIETGSDDRAGNMGPSRRPRSICSPRRWSAPDRYRSPIPAMLCCAQLRRTASSLPESDRAKHAGGER